MTKPSIKPLNPCFSSGPCAKRPGWSLDVLKDAALGRSHRAAVGKDKLQKVIEDSREILGIPADYKIGIMPGSDTGSVEAAMWSLLGQRGVDLFAWESFGADWVTDAVKQLKLQDARVYKAEYGQLPDLTVTDGTRDVVFTWNGTTSGVRVPNADWISDSREGLTICDATSAVFAMDLPWQKLDVTTWSWQKVMGGEGAHGMIVLSPRAVARLESYTPAWPIPKLFRMTSGGKLSAAIFEGSTINTPSMLAVEDALDALAWMKKEGGQPAMQARSEANLAAVRQWVEKSRWAGFLAEKLDTVSCTSVCLKIVDPAYNALPAPAQENAVKAMVKALEKEGAAFDVGAYRDAPRGLRIWCGATVETADVAKLLPWLDWAYAEAMQKQQAAA